MQDELRADWLSHALDERAGYAEIPDDQELAELAQLGDDLLRLGPQIALIARADQAFDPAFTQRLRSTLLAAHPAAVPTRPAAMHAPATVPLSLARRSLRRLRALWALSLLVVAAGAIALFSLLHGAAQPAAVGLGAATRTGGQATAAPEARLQSPAHTAPHPPPPPVTPPPRADAFAPSASKATTPGTQPTGTAVAGPNSRSGVAPVAPVLPAAGAATGLHAYSSLASGRPRFILPAALPAAPASAVVYTLTYAPLDDAATRAILARFPGFHAAPLPSSGVAGGAPDAVSGGAQMQAYTHLAGTSRFQIREGLVIVPATGEVRYSAGTAPSPGRVEEEAALVRAHDWLVAHALYPVGVDAASGTVRQEAGLTRVSFVPGTPLPLAPDVALLSLTVDLDGRGRVIAAHRLWPVLGAPRRVHLLSARLAVGSLGTVIDAPSPAAPAAPPHSPAALGAPLTVQIDHLTLAYAPTGIPGQAFLAPVYLLRGRTNEPAGGQPFTATAPATAQQATGVIGR